MPAVPRVSGSFVQPTDVVVFETRAALADKNRGRRNSRCAMIGGKERKRARTCEIRRSERLEDDGEADPAVKWQPAFVSCDFWCVLLFAVKILGRRAVYGLSI